jgi:hypothetical protein
VPRRSNPERLCSSRTPVVCQSIYKHLPGIATGKGAALCLKQSIQLFARFRVQ